MNMKQTTLITIIMVALVFTGCKSDSDPKCDCPNGTLHLVGQPCCDRYDCTCLTDVQTLVNNTTKIGKEAGVPKADFDAIVAMFNNELGPTGNQLNDTMKTNFATNYTTVRVGKAGTGVSHQGTTLSVGSDDDFTSIFTYLLQNGLSGS